MSSPQRTASQDSTADSIRKRVCKACDRCRLKKSKCDGSNPCSRCKADNAICVFGERKKSHDKVYPKGYVEMLEQQQSQLVSGLQEMYKRLQAAGAWSGEELSESNGHPLTHDILAALDLLEVKHDGSGEVETFEEDCTKLQSRLLSEGAGFAQRRDSISSDSEHSQGHERTDSKPSVFKEGFNFSAPPSPPPLEHSPAPVPRQQTSYPTSQPSPLQQSSPPLTGDPQFFEAPWSYAAMQNPEQILRSKFAMQAPEFDTGMGNMGDLNNFQQWNVSPEQRFDEKIDYSAIVPPAVWPHHLGSYANMPRLQEGGLAMSMDPMVDVEFNQFLSICT